MLRNFTARWHFFSISICIEITIKWLHDISHHFNQVPLMAQLHLLSLDGNTISIAYFIIVLTTLQDILYVLETSLKTAYSSHERPHSTLLTISPILIHFLY